VTSTPEYAYEDFDVNPLAIINKRTLVPIDLVGVHTANDRK
jgi:hypothetical protein